MIGAVFTMRFDVETFMAQIEPPNFNGAVQVETAMLVNIVAASALCVVIFAPLATFI